MNAGMSNSRPQTPLLAVDIIVELVDRPNSPIIVIRRKNPPHGWALPGGFVDIGESLANAARREAREEISLDVKLTQLLGNYSVPDRDKRGHTVSAVYIARATGEPKAADDAADIQICSADLAPAPLAFDHADILRDYLQFKRQGIPPSVER